MKKLLLFLLLLFNIFAFSQSRYISQTIKKIVYTRDGGACKCCGSSVRLEYDHIVPYSCGGESKPYNIQLLCRKCNRSKSNGCFCKIHRRKIGENCCDGQAHVIRKKRSYAGKKIRCSAITKKGLRCKRKTTNPGGRCFHHD